jgi:hypothetical protein
VTRTGPSRPGDAPFAAGRLESARAFHDAARDAAALAGEGANANPIVAQVVNAAIAYADALTATFSGRVNQRDHAAVRKALRAALGNRLPTAQERRLARILGHKDEAQYGAGRIGLTRARQLLEELDELAAWAEAELRRR